MIAQEALSFHQRDDVLFCRVEQGECQLIRAGDPEDSEAIVAATKDPVLNLDGGLGPSTVLRGGRFVFDTTNEELLTGLLPSLIYISRKDSSSWRVRSLLNLNETESALPGPGSEFVKTRVGEIILVELLRQEALRVDGDRAGLLAGLSDPIVAVALSAMHADNAHDRTVASLARVILAW